MFEGKKQKKNEKCDAFGFWKWWNHSKCQSNNVLLLKREKTIESVFVPYVLTYI